MNNQDLPSTLSSLKDMIRCRKSVRSYKNEIVSPAILDALMAFLSSARALYPEIRVLPQIVSRRQVHCILPWTTSQLLAFYSAETEGDLENAGFLLQQAELWLQSRGLGVCYLGMGRMDAALAKKDGMRCVMLLSFGFPKGDGQRTLSQFRRRAPAEIADSPDPLLEPARLAPSSVNSQPWYFIHEGEILHAYCAVQGLHRAISDMNRIDMGIALAHLYVEHPGSFRFFKVKNAPPISNRRYIGSFSL